jgi:pimeloyl-ACP methyl ester carboxylesterase
MPTATANGIQIEYETFGDPSSPPLLLVMGLGAQMIMWEDEFCDLLARRGLQVIRFDNRDVGLSSHFDEAGESNLAEAFANPQANVGLNVPYTLDDMADDAVGLLAALGIEKAHILGISMGGMIAQTVAIRHPSRTWSLISMASGPGDPSLPLGTPEAMAALVNPPPTERGAYIEHNVKLFRVIDGSKYPSDEKAMRRLFERSFDRCHHPQGMARHAVAVTVAGDRTEALRSVTAPTLVIHGSEDPLLPIAQGQATAEAVPGAELLIIEGMGHSLPAEVWPLLVDAVVRHSQRAGA